MENLYDINGVTLCAETFGSPDDPAVLLIHGASSSMVWWETELCERIASHGRYVIRYDQRDTGRSTSYPVGRPGYALSDLARDAVGLLDVLGVQQAHVVGCSMSGAVALALGVDHSERVASVTLVSTSNLALPMGVVAFPDRADCADDVEYVVESMRAYAGTSNHFDPAGARALAELDLARTRDLEATLTNHYLMDFDGPDDFSGLAVPVLVVHGELDPVFPLPHGEALRDAIPGAVLVVLEGSGHIVERPSWDTFVDALVKVSS